MYSQGMSFIAEHGGPRARRAVIVTLVSVAALVVGAVPGLLGAATVGAEETDFNGDGRSDVFWYAPGPAADHTWYGKSGGGFTSRSTAINGTYETVTGDFNGDGRSDIFWYGPGSTPDYIWYGQSGGGFSSRSAPINGTYEPVTGDFNDDGRTDIFWYGVGSTPDYIWYGQSGGGFTSRAQSISGRYDPVGGDFNGDDQSDIFWYGVGSTPDYIWYGLAGGGFHSVAHSISGRYEPVEGDFNGDGRSDIFWYGAGATPDYTWYGRAGGGFDSRGDGINGTYVPVPGDFNGDDQSDIFWYGEGATPDYIWYGLAGGGFYSVSQSISGAYEPIIGDFNGDGRSDVFWYGAGSAADYVWYGLAGGGFTSRSESINGVYQLLNRDVSSRLAPAAPGDRGPAVVEIQTRLRELNFFVPRTDGVYDGITAQAVMAFQKYHGLARDGVAGETTVAVMDTAEPATAQRGGNHVEVSIAKQTLTVVRDGRTVVFNTSTGRPGMDTPRGWYAINRQINGLRVTPTGAELWRPKYFNAGIAMHGYPSVPPYPASHGCTRLHDEAMNHIWDAGLAPLGTPVWVH